MITVAIIDSGVNPTNPHVGGLAGGVGVRHDGRVTNEYVDRLGHGTAVLAAIHEKAPAAALYVVKIFDRSLSAEIAALVGALEWAASQKIRLVNLSLGTSRPEHEPALKAAVARLAAAGTWIVAAAPQDGVRWLPGDLGDVIGVEIDWTCPRDRCRVATAPGGRLILRASGYPRPVPGVSPERNLKGISFAVANATGLLAKVLARHPLASQDEAVALASAQPEDRGRDRGPLAQARA